MPMELNDQSLNKLNTINSHLYVNSQIYNETTNLTNIYIIRIINNKMVFRAGTDVHLKTLNT